MIRKMMSPYNMIESTHPILFMFCLSLNQYPYILLIMLFSLQKILQSVYYDMNSTVFFFLIIQRNLR